MCTHPQHVAKSGLIKMASRATTHRTATKEDASRRKRASRISVTIRASQYIPMAHQLQNLPLYTKIASVKTAIEHDFGILPEMYYLTYLDAAPVEDDKTLLELDIIDGSTLDLRTWKLWADLVEACHRNNAERCLAYPGIRGTTEWNRHCAWSALFMAAHRGYYIMVSKILEQTAVDVNRKSSSGWTALHAAARAGTWKALCVLINHGADVGIKSSKGLTGFDLARQFGNKKCEDTLGFCQWSLQKHKIVQERKSDYSAAKARENASRQAHQFRDSTLKTWLGGPRGQLYMSQIPNPITLHVVTKFEEEMEMSTKNPVVAPEAHTPLGSTTETSSADGADEEAVDRKKTDFHYGWFDPLRAQHFIPPTKDILNYADPSSFQLRPRSIVNPDGYRAAPLSGSRRFAVQRVPPANIPSRGLSTTVLPTSAGDVVT